jgi:alanine transaminase
MVVNPPRPGDESYALYSKERDEIYESLKRRAVKLSTFFNTLEGVSCNPAHGK